MHRLRRVLAAGSTSKNHKTSPDLKHNAGSEHFQRRGEVRQYATGHLRHDQSRLIGATSRKVFKACPT
jgi:hypothetical protein